ncbi:arginyl-tRNA--protein transferase 1-like isoform X3 [Argonauta hians]
MAEYSLVEYFQQREGYTCGYCKSSDSNYSHGMWAHFLTVQDYQDLINRGWRRSGKYCYKPTMDKMCCPSYAVRCHAINFKLSSSHKKVIKRVNRFLIHGIRPEAAKKETGDCGDDCMERDPEESLHDMKETSFSSNSSACSKESKPSKQIPKPGLGANPNKPLPKKAKLIRMERKKLKLSQQQEQHGMSQGTSTTKDSWKANLPSKDQNLPKTLEDLLDEPDQEPDAVHKLEIRLIQSVQTSSMRFKESHQVYYKYQTNVHNDPPQKPNVKQYISFLVDSPLIDKHRNTRDGSPYGYGSFHQQYILDGKIIAVGVLDILPDCISSVYLYYDPEYSFLSLGTYSALREIAMVRSIHKVCPKIEYYYMGYYIHSCPKMRYKGQYFPSFLLCPETYHWYPIEKCRPKLNENKYSRFSESDKVDENGNIDLNRVLIQRDHEKMSFEMYQQLKPEANDKDLVMEYAGFAGKECAQRMFLYRK